MRYKKGRFFQKTSYFAGKIWKRHRAKRTCKEDIEVFEFLDIDDPRVQPTTCECMPGEYWGTCPMCGKVSGE